MAWSKSRSNKNAFKLLKQNVQCEFEWREYGVKGIRKRNLRGVTNDMIWWDLPMRSRRGHRGGGWKGQSKNPHQYKQK